MPEEKKKSILRRLLGVFGIGRKKPAQAKQRPRKPTSKPVVYVKVPRIEKPRAEDFKPKPPAKAFSSFEKKNLGKTKPSLKPVSKPKLSKPPAPVSKTGISKLAATIKKPALPKPKAKKPRPVLKKPKKKKPKLKKSKKKAKAKKKKISRKKKKPLAKQFPKPVLVHEEVKPTSRIARIIASSKKKERKRKISRKKAAQKAWQTRRKKLRERIKELEAKAQQSDETRREVIVLKEKLKRAGKIHIPHKKISEIKIIGTVGGKVVAGKQQGQVPSKVQAVSKIASPKTRGNTVSAASSVRIPKGKKVSHAPIVIREITKPIVIGKKQLKGKLPHAIKLGGEKSAAEIAAPIKEISERTKRIEEAIGRKEIAKEVEKKGLPKPKVLEEEFDEAVSDDEKIALVKRMMKRLEYDYYKRHISEEEYKKRLAEYKTKLAHLEESKKIIQKREELAAKIKAPVPSSDSATVSKEVKEAQGREEVKSSIEKMIESKAAGKIDPKKIDSIEEKVTKLLKKYNIPESEIEKDIAALDKNRILQDFDKLINLIELEHRAKAMVKKEGIPKIEPQFREIHKKKEEIKAIAKEISKHKIVTDFDKVLSFIRKKGKTTPIDIGKKFGLKKKRLNEILEVLEENKLIVLSYPPIGSVRVLDVNYVPPKKKKAKNNKEKKPNKVGFG